MKVCPTAIDIRNGTQLECVNCTACIDACDEVMEKIERPKKLIKFSSENAILKGHSKIFTTRAYAYAGVLLLLLLVLVSLIASRNNVDTTILRAPGILFQKVDSTHYSNLYMIKSINKTYKEAKIDIVVTEPANAVIKQVGKDISIKAESKYDGQFFLTLESASMTGHKTKVVFDVFKDGEKIETIKTNFLGPIYK